MVPDLMGRVKRERQTKRERTRARSQSLTEPSGPQGQSEAPLRLTPRTPRTPPGWSRPDQARRGFEALVAGWDLF